MAARGGLSGESLCSSAAIPYPIEGSTPVGRTSLKAPDELQLVGFGPHLHRMLRLVAQLRASYCARYEVP